MTKTRNRTLLSNNHTKPRESHSQKATTQKTRSPATVRYGTAAAVVQLHRMQSTYAACAGAALSHKEKTLRKRTTQPKSLPPKTRRKPPEDPRANRGGRIQEDSHSNETPQICNDGRLEAITFNLRANGVAIVFIEAPARASSMNQVAME